MNNLGESDCQAKVRSPAISDGEENKQAWAIRTAVSFQFVMVTIFAATERSTRRSVGRKGRQRKEKLREGETSRCPSHRSMKVVLKESRKREANS
jgi:hypothetical protein